MESGALGLYLHVPYCRIVCPYCDFVKQRTEGSVPSPFVDALEREILEWQGPSEVSSIFLGGGTPSLLTAESLHALFAVLRERFVFRDPEITIEVNPDDVEPGLVEAWKEAGISRVSVGVQSFDDDVLKYLGRIHDAAGAIAACEAVAGTFENWGMDLIFGALPVETWEPTLRRCVSLEAPHVSAYGLTYEDRTPFSKRRSEAIGEDLSLELYRAAMDGLSDYEHYEISNFARAGFQSRHNMVYWHNGEYAGFGPGAYSYVGGVRSRNEPKIEAYLEEPGKKCEELRLTSQEIRIETLIQHFRTRSGILKSGYAKRFGSELMADFGGQLEALMDRGLILDGGETFRPTQRGFELNDEIGMALVLEDAGVFDGTTKPA